MKSAAFQDERGWRVRLEVDGRLFVSGALADKGCAETYAEQQHELRARIESGRGGSSWESFEVYLSKLVPWYGWEELQGEEERGMEEQQATAGVTKNPFNVKKTLKEGQCAAMRCQETPIATVDGTRWGHNIPLPLCRRHGAEAGATVLETSGETTSIVPVAQEGAALAAVPHIDKVVTADLRTELEGMTKDAEEVILTLRDFKIDSQMMLETVSEVLRDVKAKLKTVNEVLEELEKPYATLVGQIRGHFAPARKKLAQAELELKKLIGQAKLAEVQDNLQSLQRVAEAHEAGDAAALQQAHTAVRSLSNVTGVSTRMVWTYEVTDVIGVLQAVVDGVIGPEALMPNPEFFNAYCGQYEAPAQEPPAIPGVRFTLKPIVAAKASQA